MLQPYRQILSRPGALAFSSTGLIARLPMSMVGIGIVFMIEQVYESYGLAGRISGTYVLVFALCAPQLGRLADRYGQARVMRPAVVVAAVTLAAFTWIATEAGPVPLLYVTAALSGATTGSLGAMVRARWTHMLPNGRELHTAYAFESTLDEVVFVTGPVVVTLLATLVSPAAGLAVPVVALVGGGLLFLGQRSTEPPPAVRDPAARHRFVLLHPGMVVIALVFVAVGSIFGATDVAVIAFTEELGLPSAAGFMLSIFALGSLISGLGYGARHWVSPLWNRFAIGVGALAVGTSLFYVLDDGLVLLTVVMFVAGFAIAPTLITGNALAQRIVPPAQLTEGLTWVSTALAGGVAAGAAVAGQWIDSGGAHAGFGVVSLSGLTAVLVVGLAALGVVLRRRRRAAQTTVVPNRAPSP